ncbi:MAG: hypothetical protein ACPL1A_07855 [Candidatus Kapaibacteriota bacterium]
MKQKSYIFSIAIFFSLIFVSNTAKSLDVRGYAYNFRYGNAPYDSCFTLAYEDDIVFLEIIAKL